MNTLFDSETFRVFAQGHPHPDHDGIATMQANR
jgi:hypothetical protein